MLDVLHLLINVNNLLDVHILPHLNLVEVLNLLDLVQKQNWTETQNQIELNLIETSNEARLKIKALHSCTSS